MSRTEREDPKSLLWRGRRMSVVAKATERLRTNKSRKRKKEKEENMITQSWISIEYFSTQPDLCPQLLGFAYMNPFLAFPVMQGHHKSQTHFISFFTITTDVSLGLPLPLHNLKLNTPQLNPTFVPITWLWLHESFLTFRPMQGHHTSQTHLYPSFLWLTMLVLLFPYI